MRPAHVPAPMDRPFWTPGVMVLAALALTGLSIVVARFVFGLAGVTHLDRQFPWGLWIAIDVATGVALAAGGFTSAALVFIFHHDRFRAVARPALLTAMLGYTFVVLGLAVDLGRPYNIWHPLVPWMGNPNSVLFEVGICVTIYLNLLYLEFAPIVLEHFSAEERWPRLAALSRRANDVLERFMFLFIIAGVVLSCAHQSSLGGLMVIAPSKVHPLWWTPVLPLLFLLSALAVGFPMVIVESLAASRSLKFRPELDVLEPLARYVPGILGLYLAVKIGDMLIRETWTYLFHLDVHSVAFAVELFVGGLLPFLLTLSWRVRRSPKLLFASSLLVVLGVALNRVNVFIVSFQPRTASGIYVPALSELLVTVGLVAGLILAYRALVTWLPIISQEASAAQPKPTNSEVDDAKKQTVAA